MYDILFPVGKPSTHRHVSQTALPVIEKLDPYNFFIMYKLFRESTRSTESGPVKDLSYLNRPLDRVLIVRTQIFTHSIS
jgi:TFIIF-interacting CTD phosphatase-like protein